MRGSMAVIPLDLLLLTYSALSAAAQLSDLRHDPVWLRDANTSLIAIQAAIDAQAPCPGCPDCEGFADAEPEPMPGRVHGVRRAHAIVMRCLTEQRGRHAHTAAVRDLKRLTHRRHRRAWRVWAGDPSRPEPSLRSLTSWEVW